jgi:hypothetical protein
VPALIMAVFQLTVDRRWLGERYRVRPARRVNDNDYGGPGPAVIDEIRDPLPATTRWSRRVVDLWHESRDRDGGKFDASGGRYHQDDRQRRSTTTHQREQR